MAAVTSPTWRTKAPEITAMDAPWGTGNEHNSPCLWVLLKGTQTGSHRRSWKELQFLPTSFVPSSPVVLLMEVPAGSVSRARGLHSSLPCRGCSLSHLFPHFSERCHFSLPPSSPAEREGREKTRLGGDPAARQTEKLRVAERGRRDGSCRPLPSEREGWGAQRSREQRRLVEQGWTGNQKLL